MTSSTQESLSTPAQLLSQTFLLNYPVKSARYIETLPPSDAAETLVEQPLSVVKAIWQHLPAGASDKILSHFPDDLTEKLIEHLDAHFAAALLSRMTNERQKALFAALPEHLVAELKELLDYPADTAARIMKRDINAFSMDIQAGQALTALKQRSFETLDMIYVLDENQQLMGEFDLAILIKAKSDTRLKHLMKPPKTLLSALDHKDVVIEKFEGYRCNAIAVLDAHQQIIGAIRFSDIYHRTKEDLATDMQTMVGASKDERALSSSWFAVKKRMPWLQINLLTAFLAAAVVGAFEGLISEITALAILLPVAAGQSGNAGAQALAVTMRGLTLREITLRNWPQVLMKEMATGLLNGIAIAITCSICVYLWSQSFGLALVIALAMVSSLVIAGSAGAVVPIALKRFGLDPAQSSSIVLTTITDIAGFMSFLGIAMLLSDMLPRG